MTHSPTPTWKCCVLTPRANRRVRDTLALALVNLTSVCWLPVRAIDRRPSAVELTTAFISQHNQHSDLHRCNAPNTGKRYKHPDNRIRLAGQLARPQPARLARSCGCWNR